MRKERRGVISEVHSGLYSVSQPGRDYTFKAPAPQGKCFKNDIVTIEYFNRSQQSPVILGGRRHKALNITRRTTPSITGIGYWDQERKDYRKSRNAATPAAIQNTTAWTYTLDDTLLTNEHQRICFYYGGIEYLAFITQNGSDLYLTCLNADTGALIFRTSIPLAGYSSGTSLYHNVPGRTGSGSNYVYSADLYFYNDRIHLIHWLRDFPSVAYAVEGASTNYPREFGYYLLNIKHYEYSVAGALLASNNTQHGLIEWTQHPIITAWYYPYTTLGGLQGYLSLLGCNYYSHPENYMMIRSFVMKDGTIYIAGRQILAEPTASLTFKSALICCFVGKYNLTTHAFSYIITPNAFTSGKYIVNGTTDGIACATDNYFIQCRGEYLISTHNDGSSPTTNTTRGLTYFSQSDLSIAWEDTTAGRNYNVVQSAKNTAFERIYAQQGNTVSGFDLAGAIQYTSSNWDSLNFHVCYSEDDHNVLVGYDTSSRIHSEGDGTSAGSRNWYSDGWKGACATNQDQIFCGHDYYTKEGALVAAYTDSADFFCYGSKYIFVTFYDSTAKKYKIRALS